jgi:twitching motility protein PilT
VAEQREVGLDTLSFHHALKHVLRQDPDIIMIGEMRDSISFTAAMSAADTGHLVLSTLHTTDASKTVERVVGVFPLTEQQTIRSRFARSFRYIVSQRLLPRKGGTGRVAAMEILKSTMRTREYLEKGEVEGKSLLDAMRDGDTEGMQHFDGEIEKLVRADMIDYDTAMAYSTNPGNLRLQLADLLGEAPATVAPPAKVHAKEEPKKDTELEIE